MILWPIVQNNIELNRPQLTTNGHYWPTNGSQHAKVTLEKFISEMLFPLDHVLDEKMNFEF